MRSVLEHMAIQADADLNAVDQDGETALMVVIGEKLDSRTYAVSRLVCITLIEAGWPLHMRFNSLSIVLAGSDLTIANSNAHTALQVAIRRGDPILVKCLLEHGAPVDVVTSQLRTPLIAAIFNFGSVEPADMQLVIEALIAANASLNAIDEDGNTALVMTISQANSNMTHQVPAFVCVALIEAGPKYYLQQMHWFETCVTVRYRPHDCKLNW